jgi:hypothetical protein
MKKKENNYAFIDSQNLHLGIQKLGWKLDYARFRIYLYEGKDKRKAPQGDGTSRSALL